MNVVYRVWTEVDNAIAVETDFAVLPVCLFVFFLFRSVVARVISHFKWTRVQRVQQWMECVYAVRGALILSYALLFLRVVWFWFGMICLRKEFLVYYYVSYASCFLFRRFTSVKDNKISRLSRTKLILLRFGQTISRHYCHSMNHSVDGFKRTAQISKPFQITQKSRDCRHLLSYSFRFKAIAIRWTYLIFHTKKFAAVNWNEEIYCISK